MKFLIIINSQNIKCNSVNICVVHANQISMVFWPFRWCTGEWNRVYLWNMSYTLYAAYPWTFVRLCNELMICINTNVALIRKKKWDLSWILIGLRCCWVKKTVVSKFRYNRARLRTVSKQFRKKCLVIGFLDEIDWHHYFWRKKNH